MTRRLEWRDLDVGGAGQPTVFTSVTEAEAAKLAELAKGKTVAEIGTAYGFSAIVMALAGARVVTADPHEDMKRIWRGMDSRIVSAENAEAHGVSDRIEFRLGPASEVFRPGETYDGIFIDGDHRYEAVKADAALADRLVPDGWIAFHDYGEVSCPDVKRLIDEQWGEPKPSELTDTLYVRFNGSSSP